MFATLMISLREFLEVFLIIGVFLGISKKLNIKREKEIVIASIVGIIISFILPVLVFLYGDKTRFILTKENAELLESYLMIFSGFFIAYVVFSLHAASVRNRSKRLFFLSSVRGSRLHYLPQPPLFFRNSSKISPGFFSDLRFLQSLDFSPS